ncbi:MAG TPA: OpgC domain-containing protein [Vicinamibacterales bacterium]|nr:OpgC domain-containing protein [Vicinamibacterales bacterium]
MQTVEVAAAALLLPLSAAMLSPWSGHSTSRDKRIDWLRGLAMVCVIVDHSRRSSLLSWFSYQRLWVVTAAEVFVVLSGIVLGMVYGARLMRYGIVPMTQRLLRRAGLLYFSFIAVTLSVLGLALIGVDTSAVATWDPTAMTWFLDPQTMTAANWRDLALLRFGPWPFEIIALYVCLVLVAVPCLIALRVAGWRTVLAASWAVYGWYWLSPRGVTGAEFEVTFPLLAWQLLFVHGIVIGYHRDHLAALAARCPRPLSIAVAATSVGFMAFALSNPSGTGPWWLRWRLVSPEAFSALYERYFSLSDLGLGRLLNLAVALPTGYAILAWRRLSVVITPLQELLATLGQRSLAAFVLHVYGLILLAHLPDSDQLWTNTLMQILLIGGIAAVLGWRRVPESAKELVPRRADPIAA